VTAILMVPRRRVHQWGTYLVLLDLALALTSMTCCAVVLVEIVTSSWSLRYI